MALEEDATTRNCNAAGRVLLPLPRCWPEACACVVGVSVAAHCCCRTAPKFKPCASAASVSCASSASAFAPQLWLAAAQPQLAGVESVHWQHLVPWPAYIATRLSIVQTASRLLHLPYLVLCLDSLQLVFNVARLSLNGTPLALFCKRLCLRSNNTTRLSEGAAQCTPTALIPAVAG